MIWIILTAAMATLLLAFANGANDNAKGVATLIGSKILSLDKAVLFAAFTTFLGSVAAIVLAAELTSRFSGKGIVDAQLVADVAFPLSVGIGAAITVLIATVIGMPISTTHAMVGSIVGIGLSADALHWDTAASKFFIPLLVSPLIAVTLAALLYLLLRKTRQLSGVSQQTCLCVGREVHPVALTTDGTMVMQSTGVTLSADDTEACEERYVGRFAGVDAQKVLSVGHLFSAAALSFGRGLNDTPKIAAVMIAAGVALGSTGAWGLGDPGVLVVTGIGIAVGGLLAVKRVARTMSYKITGMNEGQAFSANIVTASLVIFASKLGVPVSTTHVSCGSLFGIGTVNRQAHWGMIGKVLLAWVTTLPVGAMIAGMTWRVLGGML